MANPSLKIPLWHIALATLIVLGAFALRSAVVFERAAGDPVFYPPDGNDMRTYLTQAETILAGGWTWGRQPGPSLLFALLMGGMGTREPGTLMLALSLLDALAAGALIGCGWLLTRRLWAGHIAGALYALYPLSVFYGTTLLADPLGAQLLAWGLLLTLWQTERARWPRTILLGGLLGALLLTRNNLFPLAVALLVAALWGLPRRQLVAHVGVAVALALALNTALATSSALDIDMQLYSGNNRDANGFGGASMAFIAKDTPTYWQALAQDVLIAPLRFAGLLLHKWAASWSSLEFGNNIDYLQTRAVSPTLQALPGDFALLAVGAGVGLAALWNQQRRLALGWLAALGMFTLALIATFALSRLRYPMVVLLLPLWSVAAVALVDGLRQRARRWPLAGGAAAGVAASVLFPLAVSAALIPPKPIFDALPNGVTPLNVAFGESGVRLVGWRTLRFWEGPARGWMRPDQAYTVQLYWALDRPTELDYTFHIAYVVDDVRYAGADSRLGHVSFPFLPTSRWQPDRIYSEIVAFKATEPLPLATYGEIRVGVYHVDLDTEILTDYPVTEPAPDRSWVLQTLAFYDGSTPAVPDDLPRVDLRFGTAGGDQIVLETLDVPTQAAPNETITLRMVWRAVGDVARDYRLFLHVMDADDQLAAQGDRAPHPVPSSNWQPGYPFYSEMTLTMPEQAGEYAVYLGLIEAVTRDRLPIDAPDFRPRVATITVGG
ncbi:hypothetical protein VZO05_10910 [Aggregatilineales bacterium SYSU G02658]